VFIGNGQGTFQQAGQFGFGQFEWFATADFNADGKLDLVETNLSVSGCTSYVYLGKGDGTFSSGAQVKNTPPWFAVPLVGDFNGDGKPCQAISKGNRS
jgi:FG-GAP-like repeat